MKILVVENHETPSLGVVGETLLEIGAETDTVWGALGGALPSGHRNHHGLIVLGGAMTALSDDERPYFPDLTSLIRDFAEADKPVLGICLGAQLVARAFDAELHLGGEFEFGFHTIHPTAAAADDAVLAHFDAPLPLFQWHTDHYALPPGAVLLATADRYRNQCYRIGRAVYGMQFHFEATEPLVRSWINATPDFDGAVPDYPAWLPAQFQAHEPAATAFCREVTRRWAALA